MDMTPYFSGKELFGDDFDEDAIRIWFEDEESGFYNLINEFYFPDHQEYDYEYHKLNEYHVYRHLKGQTFEHCLAIGCARGDDIMPIAPQVQYFTCIEPAEKWWRDKIGETPAKYISPRPDGIVPLDDSTVDLVVALSVLHHVPNVSTILREVARVMRRGGRFILHEPIISMGDWRQNRPGLTKNERGLPLPWLRQMIVNCGFSIEKLNYCQFPTTSRLGRLLGVSPYNNLAMIWQDHMISELMRWNLRYHRRNFFEKLTPTAIFTILRKN